MNSHEYFNNRDIKKLVLKYDSWLVKLRFVAFLVLLLFSIGLISLPVFNVSPEQFVISVLVSVIILCYNLFFSYSLRNNLFNIENKPIEFAAVQIFMDLLALSIIIYFTGGIESPLFLFFIFHIVIGSILLPAFIIYPLGILLGGTLLLVSLFELYNIIPHYNLLSIKGVSFYNIPEIVYGINLFFMIVIMLTIFITKKLANEIFDKELELATAEEDKQKFIVAIVHELKSPIAASASLIDLVLNGYAGKIDDIAKEKIEKSKLRLNESISSINNILEVSKYKLSHEINRAQLTVTELLKPIIENSSTIAESKKINLKHPELNEKQFAIEGDKVLLSLVFSNVIGNAVKYTPENGSVKIEISKEREDYLISVHDSGIGIPENELNKVFEDNFRSGNARKSKIEGTGTGLSLAKEIMNSHEGTITAESPSGIGNEEYPGSVFHITLKAKSHSVEVLT